MAKIAYPLSVNYVRHLDWRFAIGEVFQNTRDAVAQSGATMEVKHLPRTSTLRLVTVGASMDARALLLGHTTKADDTRAAGKFGEGLKLAMLILAREGREIRIETGDEAWTAAIERSAEFGHEPTLVVYTRKISPRNAVTIEIGGITAEMWAEVQPRFLSLGLKGEVIETSRGRLLLDPSYKGSLYVKGLFVQRMDDLAFGYDLDEADLDRDRRMIDAWNVKCETSAIALEAARNNVAAAAGYYGALKRGGTDGSYVSSYAPLAPMENILALFDAEHGTGTIPASSEEDAQKFRAYGVRCVVVPSVLADLLWRAIGSSPAQRLLGLAESATVSIDPSTLAFDEQRNLHGASALIEAAGFAPPNASVVSFAASDKLGDCNMFEGTIRIDRRALATGHDALRTLVHEVAHRESRAGDFEPRHRNAVEFIWSTIAMRIAGNPEEGAFLRAASTEVSS